MVDLFPQDRASWKKTVKRLLGVGLIMLGCFVMFVSCAERAMLYPVRFRPAPPPANLPQYARELSVQHEEGATYAHLYLGQGVSVDNPAPLVIYSHGNGELIEDYAPLGLPGYRRMGVSVLMVEYRGVGRGEGTPNKTNIDADHIAFYDLAAALPEVDPERIILHGRSMGGGIVASLALERPGAAMVLESTYSSIEDFARRLLLPLFLVKDKYDVTATLRVYERPVFMVHSERDNTIPYVMSEKNRAARPAELPLTFVSYDVGHNDPMPPQFYADVEAFFREHGILPPEAAEAVEPAGPAEVDAEPPSIGSPNPGP
ncbi:MAG: alpha/beta hydrolase [Planctomycetota bacterium]